MLGAFVCVAYALYNAAVKNLGAAPARQMIALMPLFAPPLAALLLGKTLPAFTAQALSRFSAVLCLAHLAFAGTFVNLRLIANAPTQTILLRGWRRVDHTIPF